MFNRDRLVFIVAIGTLPASYFLVGCGPPPPPTRILEARTAVAHFSYDNKIIHAPNGSQPAGADWVSDDPGAAGTSYSFRGLTSACVNNCSILLNQWPTRLQNDNSRLPAVWTFGFIAPNYCKDPQSPYGTLKNPVTLTAHFNPTYSSSVNTLYPGVTFDCFLNTPATPYFEIDHINPQFVLDDALPSNLTLSAFAPINASPGITTLRVFDLSLNNPANVGASSIASDSLSATFAYPRDSNGHPLPAGGYIGTITTDAQGSPQTTNAMEAFYIGHDDTTFLGAYGVAIANPQEIDQTCTITQGIGKTPTTTKCTSTTVGGSKPLVTLLTQGRLAIGKASSTVSVGASPTVVVPFNDAQQYFENDDNMPDGYTTRTVTGAQSALVVNTGDNSVSVVDIGTTANQTGTVSVGSAPVAAVITADQTKAYIANFASGSVSEISLSTLSVTQTISVMQHPTSLTFDSQGNLLVGGQGAIWLLHSGSFAIMNQYPMDGTVNGMSYDAQNDLIIHALLQNGTQSAPSNGSTRSNAIVVTQGGQQSYSALGMLRLSSGAAVNTTVQGVSNTAYVASPLSSYLAYPAQTAFSPPIYQSTSGDLSAVANGKSFTVFQVSNGHVLIKGDLPFPIRGVALTDQMVYFTMPESNSLVSLPIKLHQ